MSVISSVIKLCRIKNLTGLIEDLIFEYLDKFNIYNHIKKQLYPLYNYEMIIHGFNTFDEYLINQNHIFFRYLFSYINLVRLFRYLKTDDKHKLINPFNYNKHINLSRLINIIQFNE
jgi:hypothetical protein